LTIDPSLTPRSIDICSQLCAAASGILVEVEILSQIVGTEHAALSGHCHLADLGWGEPVDLQETD